MRKTLRKKVTEKGKNVNIKHFYIRLLHKNFLLRVLRYNNPCTTKYRFKKLSESKNCTKQKIQKRTDVIYTIE